ncbi:MAG: response regulator [Bdellovibrionota bacterium]
MNSSEEQRLRELLKFQILDTPDEEAYDGITSLLAELCNVPIALISLVDENRQWFKSKQGLEVNETPRDISFCRNVVENESPLIVPDTLLDPRFVNNPFVTGSPHIRFYAGMPIVTSKGFVLGSLCVLDRKPRTLTEGQIKSLKVLSAQVMAQIELRYLMQLEKENSTRIESQNELLAQQTRELLAARDAAIESTRTKSKFLALVSHEIRTPLNSVIGLSELLLEEDLGMKERSFIERIQRSGEILLETVNDILDLSKIESGKMLVEEQTFDLRQLLTDAADVARPRADAKHLALKIDLEDTSAHPFVGDSHKIRQIVLNFLSNAIKFTAHGSVTVRSETVSRSGLGSLVRISVTDTGMGIPQNQIESIFESFSQADGSITRRFGGTGLGLAICKQLAVLLKGRIGVQSVPDRGSTFWFELPLLAAEPVDTEPHTPSDAPVSFGSVNVLLVEDDPTNRIVAEGFLRRYCARVRSVGNGSEALSALRDQRYDLILTDIQMPEMDGYQLAAAVRQQEGARAHTPIIAMTGHALEGDRETCLSAGMDDYIAKPLRRAELRTLLERWAPPNRRS